jgi:hypothetical protein
MVKLTNLLFFLKIYKTFEFRLILNYFCTMIYFIVIQKQIKSKINRPKLKGETT